MSRVKNLFISIYYVIFSPKKILNKIIRNPEWIGISILNVLLLSMLLFLNTTLIMRTLKSNISKELVDSAYEILKYKQLFNYISQIVFFYIEIFLLSLLSWILIKTLYFKMSFKTLLSLIVHCKIVLILENLLVSIILFFRIGQYISGLDDYRIHIGLGFLFKKNAYSELIYFLLNSINIISIWWIIIIAIGLSMLENISKRKSVIIATIIFFLLIFIKVFLSYISMYINVNYFK